MVGQNTWDERPTLAAPGWDVLKTTWDVFFLVFATKTFQPRCAMGCFENHPGPGTFMFECS